MLTPLLIFTKQVVSIDFAAHFAISDYADPHRGGGGAISEHADPLKVIIEFVVLPFFNERLWQEKQQE
jgi:hypothetical protein